MPELTYYSFASSSDGNAGLVTDGKTHILLDAGISARRITQSLKALGLLPEQLTAMLITHSHSDHTKGVEVLRRKTPIPMYSPGHGFRALTPFAIGTITVTAFHTPHDCYPSCGFRFEAGGETLGFATDLGCVTEEIEKTLWGVKRLVLESNYDRVMLAEGPYPPPLKERIASSNGHLSNDDCAVFLRKMADNGLESAALAHLSRTNNTPAQAEEASRRALAGTPCRLCVLKRDELSTLC